MIFSEESSFKEFIKMYKYIILCAIIGLALAKYPTVQVEVEEKPEPYNFEYDITDEDGNKQGRQESGDANGHMKGTYSMQSVEGLRRWVEYVADGEGFRAWVRTNEPGTDAQDPADVKMTVEETPKLKAAPQKEKKQRYKIVKVPIGGY
ncbi:Cuticle protein 16.8 [Nymphon striatum]|nr:Cuticle protein 16.8 [Nymphon striatum]